MNLKQTIRRILREESSAKTRLKNVIEKLGPLEAVNAVGSAKKMFEIMELDYDDVEVQEYIVKLYLYNNEFTDVSFLDIKKSPNRVVIKSYIKPDTAANHTSWFDRIICDNFNKVFPFKIEPVWNFVWAKDKKTKIFVESEEFNEEENINESKENNINKRPDGRKVFYSFEGNPNYWVDDNDRIYRDDYFENKTYKDSYFDSFREMDKEFGYPQSLFGTRGLEVGDKNRTSRSFDSAYKNYGTSIVRELIKDKKITCDNCGWSWKLSEGGDDPHTCHKCWNENQIIKSELTEKCWPGYTQKGMKTMFGKRYPNCVKKKKK